MAARRKKPGTGKPKSGAAPVLPSPPPLPPSNAAFQAASKAAEARRRVLASWRGVDTRPLEIAMANRTRAAADFMPGVLSRLGLDRKRTESEVVKVWNQLIDPDVIAHAQPAGIHHGTLFVNVDSSVWLSEIVRYRRREILTRLQHAFGTEFITRISFRAAG